MASIFPAEIIVHIFRYLRLYDSESSRRVCRLWNQIGIESRNIYEIIAFPPHEELLHLGLYARDPRYLKFVTNMDELKVLLPFYEINHMISYKVVTLDLLKQVMEPYSKALSSWESSHIQSRIKWLLRLPYEILSKYKPDKVILYGVSPRIVVMELARQSREWKFDVRKVIYAMSVLRVMDHVEFSCLSRHLSDAQNSPLMLLALLCPEIAIYYKLNKFVTLEPRDEHLAKAILPPAIYKLMHGGNGIDTNDKKFFEYCRMIPKPWSWEV